MSQLAEKLLKVTQNISTPIGFHTGRNSSQTSNLLTIVELSVTDTAEIPLFSKDIVDALFIQSAPLSNKLLKHCLTTYKNIPIGVAIAANNEEHLDDLSGTDLDFLVLNTLNSINSLHVTKHGKLLCLDLNSDMESFKAVNNLDIDAVIISTKDHTSLTIEQILICRRMKDFIRKPSILSLSFVPTGHELYEIWDSGFAGIAIPGTSSFESLGQLKNMVRSLPSKRTQKRSKTEVILPYQVENSDDEEYVPDEEE